MNKDKSDNFRFTKLYLDCIDDNGNCFIIYLAKLELFFIKKYYSEVIFSDATGVKTGISSGEKLLAPLIINPLLLYSPALQIKASWKRTDDPLPQFTFRNETNNELVWNCHHPKAVAEIDFKDIAYSGLGYAETLSMTIKPWDLPIDELRWGRFLSEQHTIVWMRWKSKQLENKLFCNGIEYNDAIFEEDRISFGDGTFVLKFDTITRIRKGKLSDIFSRMPLLKLFVSNRFLNSVEIKYKAKSTVSLNSIETSEGWSLYETVTWGK